MRLTNLVGYLLLLSSSIYAASNASAEPLPVYKVQLNILFRVADKDVPIYMPGRNVAYINLYDGTSSRGQLDVNVISGQATNIMVDVLQPNIELPPVEYQAQKGYYSPEEPPLYASITLANGSKYYTSSCFYNGTQTLQYGGNILKGIKFSSKTRPACQK